MTKVIEPGVSVSEPSEENHWHAKAGPVATYKLGKMSDEAIERYGLTRYVKTGGDNDDKQRS